MQKLLQESVLQIQKIDDLSEEWLALHQLSERCLELVSKCLDALFSAVQSRRASASNNTYLPRHLSAASQLISTLALMLFQSPVAKHPKDPHIVQLVSGVFLKMKKIIELASSSSPPGASSSSGA